MNISTALIVFNMLFDQPNKKHVLIWHQRDRSISRRFIVREKKKKNKKTRLDCLLSSEAETFIIQIISSFLCMNLHVICHLIFFLKSYYY